MGGCICLIISCFNRRSSGDTTTTDWRFCKEVDSPGIPFYLLPHDLSAPSRSYPVSILEARLHGVDHAENGFKQFREKGVYRDGFSKLINEHITRSYFKPLVSSTRSNHHQEVEVSVIQNLCYDIIHSNCTFSNLENLIEK